MKKYLVIICGLLLLIACKSKELQPVSQLEAVAMAKTIEQSIKNKSGSELDNAIDLDMLADEMIKVAGEKNKSAIKSGVKEGFKSRGLGNQIIANMDQSGSYEFVRQYEKGGQQHIIFRLYGDNGLNYHDFELVKYDNKVHIKDIYIYLTGENISTTMAHAYNSAMLSSDKTIMELRNLYQQKEYKTAQKAYESLPESVRKAKLIQVIYLQIASQLDTETYTKALTEFEKLYGNEPTVQLALLDVYFVKGDYDRALDGINKIDSTVKDPFLDYYRGLIYNQKGDAATSTEYLEKLYKNKPDFEDGVVELISNYINDKEYKSAEKLIAVYKGNLKFHQDKLNNLKDLYPEDKVTW